MTAGRVIAAVGNVLRPARLTGPIFAKELRVSSRRRRNYALRVGYICLLMVFLAPMWIEASRGWYGAGGFMARMAAIARAAVMTIAWFQFCALQLLAIIMLSSSIGEEVQRRTLPALLATPIGGVQIVAGKLGSGLLRLVWLLGISVPVLALLRAFGGVPWDFVVSSTCVTLTAVLFAASLSLLMSMYSRRTYVVVIAGLIGVGALTFGLPLIAVIVIGEIGSWMAVSDVLDFLSYVSPPLAMIMQNEQLYQGYRGWSVGTFAWPVHCGVMLGMCGLLWAWSVIRVRKVALREMTGRRDAELTIDPSYGRIRRLRGRAVYWKELRGPIGGRRFRRLLLIILLWVLLCIAYMFTMPALDDDDVQLTFVVILLGLGTLVTAVLAATPIVSERESNTWPVLLTTPVETFDIVLAKAVGVLRRSAAFWALLVVHVLIFAAAGILQAQVVWQMALIVGWTCFFLTGTGLLCSHIARRTTTAVAMNVGVAVALWVVLPIVVVIVAETGPYSYQTRQGVMGLVEGNPAVQAIVVTDKAVDRRWGSRSSYHWPSGSAGASVTSVRLFGWAFGYVVAGGACMAVTGGLLRRKL